MHSTYTLYSQRSDKHKGSYPSNVFGKHIHSPIELHSSIRLSIHGTHGAIPSTYPSTLHPYFHPSVHSSIHPTCTFRIPVCTCPKLGGYVDIDTYLCLTFVCT